MNKENKQLEGIPSIIIRDENSLKVGQNEDYKRSSHNDFKTSAELKKEGFSGLRHNSITSQIELWILGEVKFAMSREEMERNPEKFENKYRDIFGMWNEQEVKGE